MVDYELYAWLILLTIHKDLMMIKYFYNDNEDDNDNKTKALASF